MRAVSMVAVIGVILVCHRANALEWTSTELTLRIKASEDVVVGSWCFRNAGDQPVHFLTVAPDCDCLLTKFEHRDFIPGESGQVTVSMSLPASRNPADHFVAVATSDGTNTRLRLKILAVNTASIMPLGIDVSANCMRQTFRIEANSDANLASVRVSDDRLRFEVRSTVPQRKWEVDVWVEHIVAPFEAGLLCSIDFGTTRVLQIARVRVRGGVSP